MTLAETTVSTKTTCCFSQLKMQSYFHLQAKGTTAVFPAEQRPTVRVLDRGHHSLHHQAALILQPGVMHVLGEWEHSANESTTMS